MKWLFASAAVFGLAVATPAQAAHQQLQIAARDHHGDHGSSGRHTQTAPVHRQSGPTGFDRQRHDWDKYNPGHSPPDWHERRGNFDRYHWQRNYHAGHRYHWRPYHRPHGWYYRRWEFGMILPLVFWTRDYWVLDYWEFGLPDPPYGYVWVRYGDDALLVNVETGEILQAVYGLFY